MGKGRLHNIAQHRFSTSLIFVGALILFLHEKSISFWLQLIGAGSLMVVVLAHIAEALNLLPWMYWGLPYSVGHYIDFGNAVLGLTLFPLGYLLHAFRPGSILPKRRSLT
jgi:hypothetical protein